jgi:hypothetical protein
VSFPNPRDQRGLPAAAVVADLLAIALIVAGGLTFKLGPYHFTIFDILVRVRTPWRPWLLAAVILTIRLLLVRRFPHFTWISDFGARRPLSLEEHHLFETKHVPVSTRLRELALLLAGFSLLVAAFTWPQILHMHSVPDHGDPLFSIWRIGWVAHQLPRDPTGLFDANIFHPERLTLTYSDSIIVPSLMNAPLLWLGVPRVVAYNLLFLSAFVLSGVAMYGLVRALTGRREAGIVSGVIFALCPFRFEHYSHLELQMTMWMPLALWGLHRAMAMGRLRDGYLTGLAYALQMLSSMYFAMYFAVYLLVVGPVLWVGHRCPRRPLLVLAAGVALAGTLIAPVAIQYRANESMIGARDPGTVAFYSAEGRDYLKPHFQGLTYRRWAGGGRSERRLFPDVTPVVLTAVALWPPLSVTRVGYAVALAMSVEGSLGLNGWLFPWLRDHVPGYSGLRVPARFALLATMTLAILSGFAMQRLIRRWPTRALALTVAVLVVFLLEALPAIDLRPVWREPPGIYAALPDNSDVVLAEFPVSTNIPSRFPDTRFEYFSTFHWHKTVNGDSGFRPPSYAEFLEVARAFPFGDSVEYLRLRGVTHITMNGAFANPERYKNTVGVLDARSDLELVAALPWEGSEARLYRFR